MKTQLKQKLSKLKGFQQPKISLEQYVTPPQLAADILHNAYMNGDIEERKVADFGAGTGVLSVGAAMLDGEVVAVDKDGEALKVAKQNAEMFDLRHKIRFIEKDVSELDEEFDTVVMNPPFSVHSDTGIDFLRKAIRVSDAVYTVSNPGLRKRIKDYVENSDHRLEALESFKISLPSSYGFHTQEERETEIDVLITKGEK
ncbi:MAG: METTL5 family protein [Candidatus Nanohaloarchaea archaeon]